METKREALGMLVLSISNTECAHRCWCPSCTPSLSCSVSVRKQRARCPCGPWHYSEKREWPPPPTCKAKIWTNTWTKYDPKKCLKIRQTWQFGGNMFVHVFALYVGGWGCKMIPGIMHLPSGEQREQPKEETLGQTCAHQNRTLSGPVLRDTARLSQRYPPIAHYRFFGVSTWPIGCDTPSPFSVRFPLGEHAKWRCDTPPRKRGISAILVRYPMKTRQMGVIRPPLRYYLEGYCAIWGDISAIISHWAAKIARFSAVAVAILTAPRKMRAILWPQDARFPCDQKSQNWFPLHNFLRCPSLRKNC